MKQGVIGAPSAPPPRLVESARRALADTRDAEHVEPIEDEALGLELELGPYRQAIEQLDFEQRRILHAVSALKVRTHPSQRKIELAWQPPLPHELGAAAVTGYKVVLTEDVGQPESQTADSASAGAQRAIARFEARGLAADKRYKFRLRGVNGAGRGIWAKGQADSRRQTAERVFSFHESFDRRGVLWWLGCGEGVNADYDNPARGGAVRVSVSHTPSSQTARWMFVDHDTKERAYLDHRRSGAWVAVDLQRWQLRPTHYSLRAGPSTEDHFALCNWQFQGSIDGVDWTLLCHHAQRHGEAFAGDWRTLTWPVEPSASTQAFRHFRVVCLDNVHLSFAGLELYGVLEALAPGSRRSIARSVEDAAAQLEADAREAAESSRRRGVQVSHGLPEAERLRDEDEMWQMLEDSRAESEADGVVLGSPARFSSVEKRMPSVYLQEGQLEALDVTAVGQLAAHSRPTGPPNRTPKATGKAETLAKKQAIEKQLEANRAAWRGKGQVDWSLRKENATKGKDGQLLSEKEAAASDAIGGIDTDGDGEIEFDEFAKWLTGGDMQQVALASRMRRACSAALQLGRSPSAVELFRWLDRDGSGTINRTELSHNAFIFRGIDGELLA